VRWHGCGASGASVVLPSALAVLLLLGAGLLVASPLAAAATTSTNDYLVSNGGWNGISTLPSLNAQLGLRTSTDKTYRSLLDSDEAVLVLLGPTRSFSSRDLYRFVEKGGRVLLADDFGSGAKLASAFGSTFSGEPLLDNSSNLVDLGWAPVVETFVLHPITLGVDAVVTNHPTSLLGKRPSDLAFFSKRSYLDLDGNNRQSPAEPSSAYSFLRAEEVGAGRIVFVADPSIFINAAVRFPGNAQLYANLLGWLVEGSGLEVVGYPADLRSAVRGAALLPYQFGAIYLVLLVCLLAIGVMLRGQPIAARAPAVFRTIPPSSPLGRRLQACLEEGDFGELVRSLTRRLKARWTRSVGVGPSAEAEAIVAAHLKRFPRPEVPDLQARLLTVGRALDKAAEGSTPPSAQLLVELGAWRTWILREIGLEGGRHERERR